ncbi:hypothetical protein CPB83DRAFT_820274 [Crepidotus variabilis]|uniref:Uncharacterized protein n=1 Tax=Crepidotus variabilis TaxID=179855 RepID=A0A9P6JL24_9AGAR|nr:hypothetical protein CPB83DRAFT_820274 [Crepidotus variabilis]
MFLRHPIFLPSLLLLAISRTSAYTWKFQQQPRECSNLTVSVKGGQPPYRLLIVPSGMYEGDPNTDPRRILQHAFTGNDKEATFQLKYPVSSQFVALVSDASGFASGGTSTSITVGSSPNLDSSCLDNPDPNAFYFMLYPNEIVQCAYNAFSLDPGNSLKVQGNPNYLGIIPGGQSFEIPRSNVSTDGSINWQASLKSTTTLILVAGDARGRGSGGSAVYTVGVGSTFDNSCLDENSPSSTPGNPAGGYPTANGNGGSGHSMRLNVGAIIGVALGGVTVLVMSVILLWWWRRKHNQRRGLRAVLLDRVDDDVDHSEGRGRKARKQPRVQRPIHHYSPEPFRFMSSSNSLNNPSSMSSLVGFSSRGGMYQAKPGAMASGGETSGRRKGLPRTPALAVVNVIQHDDAGPPLSPPKDLTVPTIVELPPAYTALKRLQTWRAAAAARRSRGRSAGAGNVTAGRSLSRTSEQVRRDGRDS